MSLTTILQNVGSAINGLFNKPLEAEQQTEQTQGSILDQLATNILGKDENGQAKPFDLSKYVTIPDFTVKADKTQGTILMVVVGFFLLIIFNPFKIGGRNKKLR